MWRVVMICHDHKTSLANRGISCSSPMLYSLEATPNKKANDQNMLVSGLEHVLFSQILGIIIPIDFHIFQRGGPTTNQKTWS